MIQDEYTPASPIATGNSASAKHAAACRRPSKFTHEGVIRVEAGRDNGNVTFRVSLHRLGDAAEQTAKLFVPFTQVQAGSAEGGTGPDLTITRRFCSLVGGDITLIG